MLVIGIALGNYLYSIYEHTLTPESTSDNPYVSHPSMEDMNTILAYSIGKMQAVRGKDPTPNPTPNKPKVGDTCPHCKGTGREPGDGSINISCGQCNGDGRVDEGDPILVDNDKPESEIESKPPSIIIVNIEGIVYTYDPNNGYFYMPDKSRILAIDPILANEIGGIKSIQTCNEADGLCKEYLLQDE